MKKLLMVVLTALCMLQAAFFVQAGNYTATGVFSGTVDPRVEALFKRPLAELANAVRDFLIANPGLGDDIAFFASTKGTPEQQIAAGTGMGNAIESLTDTCAVTPCSPTRTSGPGGIARAVRMSGNAAILAAAAKAVPTYLTQDGTYIPPAAFRVLDRNAANGFRLLDPNATVATFGGCTGSPC